MNEKQQYRPLLLSLCTFFEVGSVLTKQKYATGVALCGALGGLIFGLEIGYNSPIKAVANYNYVMTGDNNTPLSESQTSMWTTYYILTVCIAANPITARYVFDKIGRKWCLIVSGLIFAVRRQQK